MKKKDYEDVSLPDTADSAHTHNLNMSTHTNSGFLPQRHDHSVTEHVHPIPPLSNAPAREMLRVANAEIGALKSLLETSMAEITALQNNPKTIVPEDRPMDFEPDEDGGVPEHVLLARQGKLVEAGAVAEGLPRLIGCKIASVENKYSDVREVSIIWMLDDGTTRVQVEGVDLAASNIDIDFTAGGSSGELLAYVRSEDDNDS